MKKHIPTAEEFFSLKEGKNIQPYEIAREFAKLHVEKALEEAVKKAETKEMKIRHNAFIGSDFHLVRRIDRKSILSAYPTKNIK